MSDNNPSRPRLLPRGVPRPAVPANVAAFAEKVLPIAERVGAKLGVDPAYIIGQWGLETGWGKSVIPGTNNFGNIKDFSGKGVAATDNMTGSRDKYRAYPTGDDFGEGYYSLVSGQRYAGVTGAKDAQSFFSALKAGGYAEDPNYVRSGVRAADMARNALVGLAPKAANIPPASSAQVGDVGRTQAQTAPRPVTEANPLTASVEGGAIASPQAEAKPTASPAGDAQALSRLLARGVPRSAAVADDGIPAALLKAFKVADEPEAPIPQIEVAKVTPVTWKPPRVAVAETLPTDNTERYLASLAAANTAGPKPR